MADSYFADRAGPHSANEPADGENVKAARDGDRKMMARQGSAVPSPSGFGLTSGLQTQEDATTNLHDHLAQHPDIGSTPRPLSHPRLLAWHLFNIPMTMVIFIMLALFILYGYPSFHRYDRALPVPTRIIGWISISVGSGIALFLYVLRTPLYYIIEALYEGIAAEDSILPTEVDDLDGERAELLAKRAALTTWIANGVLEEVFRLLAIAFLYFVFQELISQPEGHKWPNILESTFWLGFGWNVAESTINLGQNIVNVLATRQSDLRKTLPSRLNRDFSKMFEEQDEREALLGGQVAQPGSSAFSFARDDRGRWGIVAVESGPSQSSSAQASHRPSDLEPVQEQEQLKSRALPQVMSSGDISERSSLHGASSSEREDNQSSITVRAGRSGARQLDDPLRLARPSSLLRPRFLRAGSSGAARLDSGVVGDVSAGPIALSAPTALDLELADILGAPLPYIFPPIYLLTRLGAVLLDIGFAMLLGQAWQSPSDPSSPRRQTSGLGAVILTLAIVIVIRSTLNVIYGAYLPKIGLTGAGFISILLGFVSVFGAFVAWGEIF